MIQTTDSTLLFESTATSFESGDFLVLDMRGVEALSTPYEYELTLECTLDGGAAPAYVAELLRATCVLGYGPGGTQRVTGILKEFELAELRVDEHVTIYRAVLVPRFWLTTLTRRSRCYVDTSIPDVIRDVLSDLQLTEKTDYELRIDDAAYPAREYVTQYEETDFAFLSRWMERLGLFYFFEHGSEGERLIIADVNSAFPTALDHPRVHYASRAAKSQRSDGLYGLRRVDRRRPMHTLVRDYNWRGAASIVMGHADVDAKGGVGLQAYFGEHVGSDGECEARAGRLAEAWNVGQQTFHAQTACYDFGAGIRTTLTGAPMGELDQEYLITRIVHEASQANHGPGAGDYGNRIEAIPFAVPFRAERRSPWPRIDGILSARIDAETVNAAAPIDDSGRYRVVLMNDLYGQFGGKATRWVRKAEPYSGAGYGMHFTLHVGAEVLLAHIGGDPDRPIIIGTAPSGITGTPLGSGNASRSAIRTRSGIVFDFEDDA